MASIFDGDDFKLADLDFLGDEAELRARARRELMAAGDDFEPLSRQEGTDATGAVLVAMDRDGIVQAVEVSRNWQERIAPGEFAGALLMAYHEAQAKHVNAAALAAFAAQERGEPEAARSTVDNGASPPGVHADERLWLGEIWSILSHNDDQLHRIGRGEGPSAVVSRTVSGPHGFLAARLDGSAIAGISGDADLIKSASAPQLEVEALAMFRAAREEAANGG
jgi:hypothetical protein